MAVGLAQVHQERIESRDETWRRIRVSDSSGARLPMLVVNLSPHGLMARSEEPIAAGQRLNFDLPVAGMVTADVRWSLGGRIGCRFVEAITGGTYARTLAAMQ